MARWVAETYFKTADHEMLQIITIYPEETNKEKVKAEIGPFKNNRFCLVKGNKYPSYNFKG